MALDNTTVEQTFPGNGSTTAFAIPCVFFDQEQIKVELIAADLSVTSLTQGTEYDISGASPGTTVDMVAAPASGESLRIYRETEESQEYDALDTAKISPEAIEKSLDRIVMMVQELSNKIATIMVSSLGGFQILTLQTLAALGTITVPTNQRAMGRIISSGGAVILDGTLPLDDGSIDCQELRLLGTSDVDTVQINDGGNISLKGPIIFQKGTVLDLFWDDVESVWVEDNREG